jgi:glucose/arabinose dehydrogenase
MLSTTMSQKVDNSVLKIRAVHLFASAGLTITLFLLLAACCTPAENTATPGMLQPPMPSVLTVTPILPAPTESFTPQPSPTASPKFPDPADYRWMSVLSGLELPVDIQNAGDGSGRLFIVERRGRILVWKSGELKPAVFLDITGEVDSQYTEQGLLGLAFHPDYARTGLIYVNYIDLNGNTVIARFHVSVDDPNRADPASEVDLLHVDQPYANHNGGGLAFGPDGYLYIGLGDGGSEGDPLGNGQNLQTLLGKMLRIDVDHGDPYTIPSDNPFVKGGGLPEIWTYGLRNPWRFSFDRLTGDLFIADVGQDAWEELDVIPAGTSGGMNFGWNYYEGKHPYKNQPPANASFIFPVAEYSHAEGCAVTGGYMFRGAALPQWQGIYFYGDYCSGTVWGLVKDDQGNWQAEILFSPPVQITTFGVDEAGEIYLVDYRSGTLLRLVNKQCPCNAIGLMLSYRLEL